MVRVDLRGICKTTAKGSHLLLRRRRRVHRRTQAGPTADFVVASEERTVNKPLFI